MSKNTTNPAQEPEVNTTPAQAEAINEVDGDPIFHADEEEGEDHE